MDHLEDKVLNYSSLEMHAKMCVNDAKFSLLVSCKKDSSVIYKDSYRDELPFLLSLANSSLLPYNFCCL